MQKQQQQQPSRPQSSGKLNDFSTADIQSVPISLLTKLLPLALVASQASPVGSLGFTDGSLLCPDYNNWTGAVSGP